jgi:hypothetical protein
MPVISIPKPLRERLGDEGTEALISVLDKLEHEIKDDLATKRDLKELELRLVKWVAGMLFLFSTLIIGGIIGLLKL